VLIVDDQCLVRIGIRALIEAAPGMLVVGEAEDAAEAITRAGDLEPDVILMDIRMPGEMDGIAATERILGVRGSGPRPRVLILTASDPDQYLHAALRAGVAGFLLKAGDPERLTTAISIVADGGTYFAPSITRRLIDTYVTYTDAALTSPEELARLTRREREILRLTARGLSNAQMAAQLVISETTVKSHLNRAMTKLALRTRAQAVAFAYETGLMSLPLATH
jgi:DNA-binding NarL/FixJ family response regulator